MIGCHCPAPVCGGHGASWRSRSAAADLPRQWLSGDVLDLSALRSRSALLQPRVPYRSPAAATPGGQPPLSTESRRPARPPGPAAALPGAPMPAARDGSVFPFGHFSGTIRLWRKDPDSGRRGTASLGSRTAGNADRTPAALLHLWPPRPFRRSFAPHSATKVRLSPMISPEVRAQIRRLGGSEQETAARRRKP